MAHMPLNHPRQSAGMSRMPTRDQMPSRENMSKRNDGTTVLWLFFVGNDGEHWTMLTLSLGFSMCKAHFGIPISPFISHEYKLDQYLQTDILTEQKCTHIQPSTSQKTHHNLISAQTLQRMLLIHALVRRSLNGRRQSCHSTMKPALVRGWDWICIYVSDGISRYLKGDQIQDRDCRHSGNTREHHPSWVTDLDNA
jgi:hypothetical protein